MDASYQFLEGSGFSRGIRSDDEVDRTIDVPEGSSACRPEPTLHAIAINGASSFDGKPKTGGACLPGNRRDHDPSGARRYSGSEEPFEIVRARQRLEGHSQREGFYAESRARPLSRRLFKIKRPAFVRIRARKPCLRLRRRLFGWYVRLPI